MIEFLNIMLVIIVILGVLNVILYALLKSLQLVNVALQWQIRRLGGK